MVSENIIKLRILVDELCRNDEELKNINEHKKILLKIKQIIDFETKKVVNEHNDSNRLRSYEKMFSTIQIMLNKIKIA